MKDLIIYHGSPGICQKPVFGLGKTYNDYGQGFYCTEQLELAKEWVCTEEGDGYVSSYLMPAEDLTGVYMRDLILGEVKPDDLRICVCQTD